MYVLCIIVWLFINENRKNVDLIIIYVNIMLIFKIVIVFFIFNCCLIVNNFNVIVINFFKMFSFYWIFDEEKN